MTFCRPDTRVFYFFAQREGHNFAAPLLISKCEENFIFSYYVTTVLP